MCLGTSECLIPTLESVMGSGMVTYMQVAISSLFYVAVLFLAIWLAIGVVITFTTGGSLGVKVFVSAFRVTALITIVAFFVLPNS
ncbi:hypothetical protein SAMN04488136_13066 [Vibrio xiamenensis]|uniref:Uncharacterized protein n=1 Tax=Vibrio xiamenensis TaxID=861298 RepID=A0A1G8FH91_9VIBR|nr:hypothetical protein [Vibrio xiamenensis]SDH81514.1 hypothetical protein SAMN04488136_13066 [Vibrio xiamenensis]